ncbi:hypothetical protein RDE2_10450 [Rhodococcus sp. RDE2]|nr:hypothetical protein RDE2_10450 [Rhodococcus sp. RDE2]
MSGITVQTGANWDMPQRSASQTLFSDMSRVRRVAAAWDPVSEGEWVPVILNRVLRSNVASATFEEGNCEVVPGPTRA